MTTNGRKKANKRESGIGFSRRSPVSVYKRTALLIAIIILFLVSGFLSKLESRSLRKPLGEYRLALSSEPITLDPALFSDVYSLNVGVNLFDGLVEFDKNLNVAPAVARRWIISRDHRIYTFYLRRGVKFHNGREVTAEDFIYSFQRILHPDTKSPAAPLFSYIKGTGAFRRGQSQTVAGLFARDRHTLTIELNEPFAPFLSILATANAKVVPREAIGTDFGNHPVGTGPFRFHSWDKGHSIILTANNDYFGGRAQLDLVRFRIYANDQPEVIFNDFEKGLLDQTVVPQNRYEMVCNDPGYRQRYRLVSKPGLNLVYLGINGRMPPLHDPRIRKAISHAVDTRRIATEISGRGSVPAAGILPPGIAGFDPNFKGFSYDPQKARSLLAEAGHPGGLGIPPLEIWTVSKSERVKQELGAYRKYLAEIGIQVIPKVAKNWKEFIELIDSKKVSMFYAAWYADYPDPDNFIYALFHSKSPTNRTGYQNPEVDELLEQARHETDYMKRVDMYRGIERLIMRDAPVIPQHTNSNNCLFQPWVQDVEIGYLGPAHLPLRKLHLRER